MHPLLSMGLSNDQGAFPLPVKHVLGTENPQALLGLYVGASHTMDRRSETSLKIYIIVASGMKPLEGVDNLFIKLGIISIRLVYFTLSLLS